MLYPTNFKQVKVLVERGGWTVTRRIGRKPGIVTQLMIHGQVRRVGGFELQEDAVVTSQPEPYTLHTTYISGDTRRRLQGYAILTWLFKHCITRVEGSKAWEQRYMSMLETKGRRRRKEGAETPDKRVAADPG